MGSKEGFDKRIHYYDTADHISGSIQAFIPIFGIAILLREMLGKSNSAGYHERKKFIDNLGKEDDFLFLDFLENSDESENYFQHVKKAKIPSAPDSANEDTYITTPRRSTITRTAKYDVINKNRSIEYLNDTLDFSSRRPSRRLPTNHKYTPLNRDLSNSLLNIPELNLAKIENAQEAMLRYTADRLNTVDYNVKRSESNALTYANLLKGGDNDG